MPTALAVHPIRRARREKQLTLRELGRLSRIHYTRICYLERGLRPREDEILRLAGCLGVAPEALQPPGSATETKTPAGGTADV